MKNLSSLILRLLILAAMIGVLECDNHIIECEEMEISIDILDSGIEVTWTVNSCTFLYIVTHVVNGEELEQIRLPHPMDSARLQRFTCSRNTIIIDILKLPNTGEFTPPSKDFVIGLDGSSMVQNLKFNEENSRFEWDAPDNSEDCELEYEINFTNEITTDKRVIKDLFYQCPLYFCSNNELIVTTIIGIEELEGESTSAFHSISIPEIKEVHDLRFNEDLSRFEWAAPDRSEICGLEYEIKFENQEGLTEAVTSDEFFEIAVQPCSINTISVITLISLDLSRSEAVTDSHTGPVARQLPMHIRTNPQENSVEVTWYIEYEPLNLCQIDELRYELTHTGSGDTTKFSKDFEEGRDFEFVMAPLEVDQIYQYSLCYVFSTSEFICSPHITFLTRPLPKPIIIADINADENIEISWDQTYYSSFVTGHTIIIEPIGPNHFVPSGCYFDKTPIEKYFDHTITSYIVEDAEASFKYNIQVITHFDGLGMTTSDDDVINTNEAIPGRLDIQSSYQFGPTFSYDAALLIRWTIPCDINGKPQKFSYKVTGVLSRDFISTCGDVVASGTITAEEDVQEIYDVPIISRIYPFFRYSVEVITYLEHHEGVSFVNLEDPPEAYTPPS